MNFFPTIYDDELLYSVIARYHINSGNTTYRQTMIDVFSNREISVSIYLQNNIIQLVNNLPKYCDYTASEIIYNNTLYPFYTAFMNKKSSDEIYNLMLGNKNRNIYAKCGIISSSAEVGYDKLKFCPKCIEEELERYGTAYWHRAHQIPGYLVCTKHKGLLQDSIINKNRYNKYELVLPNRENCPINNSVEYTSKTIEKMHRLAENIDYIINTKLERKNKEWFNSNYKNYLKSINLSTLKGVVRYTDLKESFKDYYGKEFLDSLNLKVGYSKNDWLKKITDNTTHINSPIKNLLLIDFLGTTPRKIFSENFDYNPFGTGPWPCINKKKSYLIDHNSDCISLKYNYKNNCIIGNFKCKCGSEYKVKYLKKLEFQTREIELRKKEAIEYKNFTNIIKRLDKGELIVDPDLGNVSIDTHKKTFSKEYRKQLDESIEKTRNKHRTIWTELLENNKTSSKIELINMAISTASWLYKFDSKWFEENSPEKKQSMSNNNLNWDEIDKNILREVKFIVEKIYEDDEIIVKVTKDRIGKSLNRASWFRFNLNKMPKTLKYVNENIENNQEFRIRKVKYKVRKFYRENKKITITNIIGGMILNEVEKEEIKSVIKDELNKLK